MPLSFQGQETFKLMTPRKSLIPKKAAAAQNKLIKNLYLIIPQQPFYLLLPPTGCKFI